MKLEIKRYNTCNLGIIIVVRKYSFFFFFFLWIYKVTVFKLIFLEVSDFTRGFFLPAKRTATVLSAFTFA